MTDKSETRTITMTGRRPVRIRTAEWPVIAQANGDSYSGTDAAKHQQGLAQGEFDLYHITVRQNENRVLVYGKLDPGWHNGQNRDVRRGGVLTVASGNVAGAIEDIAQDIGLPDWIVRACIADLPPEEI